ncbi:response regulator transcription factor, partial [bacterium]|nr:response regulator transcription factor [bacterium]
KIIENNRIDLVLMDIGLPDVNGIDATRHIKTTYGDIKIAILTSHCDKDEVLKCLEAGICAYCTKDIKPEKLALVIKDILEGSMYFDSSVAKYVLETTSKIQKHELTIKDCYNLTTQEKRVLILLASGNNNSQIAKKLKISVNTTKVHVCSILQKMNVEDRTQAAIKAIRENLII